MIEKESNRFSMPALLTATAKESKVKTFQVVLYFEDCSFKQNDPRKYTKQGLCSCGWCEFAARSWPSGKNEKPY